MVNTIKFPAPKATDADLLNSLRELGQDLTAPHAANVEALIQKIMYQPENHRVAPLAFAWYRELALKTLYPADEQPVVSIGLNALRASCLDWQSLEPQEMLIVTPNDKRSPYNAWGWSKLLNEGTDGLLKLEAPRGEEVQKFLEKVEDALKVFKTHAPNAHAEWQAALRMIVAVRECEDSEIRLAGGSSLFLPGVIVVNVAHCDTTANTLATLVHEAAHVRLNSLCSHEPLSRSSPDARYTSPLRSDGRPMEGVIHATFVCATIVDLFSKIAASLDDNDIAEDYSRIASQHIEPIRLHIEQIARDGELTEGGEQVLNFIRSVDKTYAVTPQCES